MKSKAFAKILCIALCIVLIGSVLLVSIPMITGNAVSYTPTVGSYGTINDDGVNMRSGPGMSNTIVTTMNQNTRVIFQESTSYGDSWYKVKEQTTNKSGYVYGGFYDNVPCICVLHQALYVKGNGICRLSVRFLADRSQEPKVEQLQYINSSNRL